MLAIPPTIYAPIMTLINLPAAVQYYNNMKIFKQSKPSFDTAVSAYWQDFLYGSMSPKNAFTVIMTFILSLFVVGCAAVSSEAVSQWYENPRFKSYSAITLAVLVLSMTVGIIDPAIELFVTYAFITPDRP